MRWLLVLLCTAQLAWGDMVVPVRTLRAHTEVTHADVKLVEGRHENAFDRIEDVVGQETRVALYAGRPILVDSIGPPALVERNQIVALRFERSGLVITTDGRALQRGGIGDRIRIMNLSSRSTLFGFVEPDGTVSVK